MLILKIVNLHFGNVNRFFLRTKRETSGEISWVLLLSFFHRVVAYSAYE